MIYSGFAFRNSTVLFIFHHVFSYGSSGFGGRWDRFLVRLEWHGTHSALSPLGSPGWPGTRLSRFFSQTSLNVFTAKAPSKPKKVYIQGQAPVVHAMSHAVSENLKWPETLAAIRREQVLFSKFQTPCVDAGRLWLYFFAKCIWLR